MSFTPNIIQQVWNKAKIVDGYNPEIFRKDPCGAWIIRNKYGATDNPYGWVIDHVYPKFLGGDDNLRNLRAMHWRNNESKGIDCPSYIARIKSDGNRNVECFLSKTISQSLYDFIIDTYINK